MIFGDNDKLSGFVIPMTNKTVKKHLISRKMYGLQKWKRLFYRDMKEEKWIYIELVCENDRNLIY